LASKTFFTKTSSLERPLGLAFVNPLCRKDVEMGVASAPKVISNA